MGLPNTVLVAVLALVATANAFHKISPGKEVVYDYRAIVRSGSLFPTTSASFLNLHGQLHLQANDNNTHVQLTDLKTTVYNGRLNHEQELDLKDIPLPAEAKELEHPFKIVYDEDGRVLGIATSGEEKEWTRNIKRALAAILQIDHQAIKNVNHPNAFSTEEHSIYGFGQVDYDVVPLRDHENHVEIHKSHHMKTSRHLYQYSSSNLDEINELTESEFQPLNHDSNRKYVLATQDGHQIVEHVEATGSLYYTPHNGKSDAQYLRANQTLELVHVVPISKQLQVPNEQFAPELSYFYYDYEHETEQIFDVTNGRIGDVDQKKIVEEVVKMVDESWQYLHEDHIHTGVPDSKRGQLINRIVTALLHLDVQHLQEVHDQLSKNSAEHHEKLVEIFHKILPLVGTKGSVLFIKKLVVNKMISSEVAVELLENFPHFVTAPTQELLKELEVFINLGDNIEWSVKKAAILSFASLIQVSMEYYTAEGQQNNKVATLHHDYIPHYNDDIEEEIKSFEKYVDEYQKKLKEAKETHVQLVYLMGLHNIQHPHVYDVLKPLLVGDEHVDHKLKVMVLFAIAPLIVENPEAVQKILWPILVNPLEYSEVRMAAYYIIMESEPGVSVMNSIYWHMVHETDIELYRFHYTFFKALAKSVDPEKTEMKHLAQRLLRYMQPAIHGISNIDFHDYKNWHFAFGEGWHGALMASNVTHILTLRQVSNHLGVYAEDSSALIRISGLSGAFLSHDSLSKLIEQKLGSHLQVDNKFEIEILMTKHGKVYAVHTIKKDNLEDLTHILRIFATEIPKVQVHGEFILIDYLRHQRALIPTDMGTPAIWEFLMPTVQYGDISLDRDISDKTKLVGKVQGHYKTWSHYSHGLTFYNPLIDIWQGVNRIHAHDTVLPLNWQIEVQFSKHGLKWSWEKNSEPQKNIVGLRSHVMTYVFARDYHQKNWLSQSSPHSQPAVAVSHGEKFRDDYTIWDENVDSIGHNVKAIIFDSGYHISNGSIKALMNEIGESNTQNESPFWSSWLFLEHLQAYGIVMPHPGVYGLLVRMEPITTPKPVSSVELDVKVFGLFQTPQRYDSAAKLDVDLKYAVKSNDEKLVGTTLNAVFSTNLGQTVNNMKMEVTHTTPGEEDCKVCVDGTEKFTHEKIEGHYNLVFSKSVDGKCDEAKGVKVQVEKLGQVSHEQKEKYHLYGSCMQPTPYWVQAVHSPQCLIDLTSVRHYTYKVKTSAEIPDDIKTGLWGVWDYLEGLYSWYSTEDHERQADLGDSKLRVDLFYPMLGHELDIHVSTPHHMYNLTGLPLGELKWWVGTPESLVYDPRFSWVHKLPYTDVCEIHPDHFQLKHNYLVLDDHTPVPNDWTVYYSHQPASGVNHVVEVKKMHDNLIAVKVQVESHVWEVVPEGEGKLPKISVNGQVAQEHVHYSDWIYHHVLDNENHNTLVAWLPQLGLQLDYFGDRVVLSASKIASTNQITGQCVKV